MANIATTTPGAPAPVYLTVARLEETRRHVRNRERISLDVVFVTENGNGIFSIFSPEIRELVPWKVGDRLKRVGKALYHPALPDFDLNSDEVPPKPAPKDQSMNTPLIPITARPLDGAEVQTVNARELHAFLEVGKEFANWIKDRIDQYGFKQGLDFEVFADSGKNPTGGRPAKEYALSLDMAKELSMVERNEKGKLARQYFLECERRAKNPIAIPQTLPEALRLAAKLAEEREAAVQKAALLENRVEEQAPKVAALERIEAGKKSLTITEAAKVLGVKRDELTKRLHAEGWIYRQNRSWVAHSAQIHAGRMEYKEAHYTDDDGNETARPYCHLTPKGLSRFAQIIGTNRDGLF